MTTGSGVRFASLLIAAALVIAAAVWFSIDPHPAPVDKAVSARPPAAVALAARPIVNDGPLRTAAQPGGIAADGVCLGTLLRIELTATAEAADECLGAPSSDQNGEIRRHQFSAASGWSLAIRVASGKVLDAVATRNGEIVATCEAAACTGISIGLPDQDAVQDIALQALPLVDADGRIQHLSARLRSAPGYACPGASLIISYSDSRYLHFCPFGGSGVVYDEAGIGTLSFRSLEGTTLRVMLDAQDRVIGVDYGAYRCTAATCIGVLALLADPLGQRSIGFSGTVLEAPDAESDAGALSISLNGRLELPPEPAEL